LQKTKVAAVADHRRAVVARSRANDGDAVSPRPRGEPGCRRCGAHAGDLLACARESGRTGPRPRSRGGRSRRAIVDDDPSRFF